MNSADSIHRHLVGLIARNGIRSAGIQAIFSDIPRVEIVPLSFAEALRSKQVNTVVVDTSATDHIFNFLATFRTVRPDLRLLVIGQESDSLHIQRVIVFGAKGFLSPDAKPEDFHAALQTVLAGSIWAPRQALANLVAPAHVPPADHSATLMKINFTAREYEVLQLLVSGRGNREIGATMGIGPVTVKSHLGRIMRKVGVANRVELTMYVIRNQSLDRHRPDLRSMDVSRHVSQPSPSSIRLLTH
jgi:DNA-binding NarL/FixJ family response regulator